MACYLWLGWSVGWFFCSVFGQLLGDGWRIGVSMLWFVRIEGFVVAILCLFSGYLLCLLIVLYL